MDNKTKAILVLLVVSISGWWVALRPRPPIEVEKIVFKDRVTEKVVLVNKDVIKTETRPDGTKIVIESKMRQTDVTKEREKASESTKTSSPLPKYSLGVGAILDPYRPLKRDYAATAGVRLWNSPIWAEIQVTTKKDVTLGLRLEF